MGAVISAPPSSAAAAASASLESQCLLVSCECEFISADQIGDLAVPLTDAQRVADAKTWIKQLRDDLKLLDDSTPLLFVKRMGVDDRFDLKLCFASVEARNRAQPRVAPQQDENTQ